MNTCVKLLTVSVAGEGRKRMDKKMMSGWAGVGENVIRGAILAVAVAAVQMAAAQTAGTGGLAANGQNDPVAIATKLGCWFVNIVSSPAIVAIAALWVVLNFGWGKLAGEINAFTSFKNSMIGVGIILASGIIVGLIFGSVCATGTR